MRESGCSRVDALHKGVPIALCDPHTPVLTKEDTVLSFGKQYFKHNNTALPPANPNAGAGKTGKPGGGFWSFNIIPCQGHQ